MPSCQFIVTTIYIYGLLAMYGVYECSRSVLLPLIKEHYSFSYSMEGTIVSSFTLAYSICCAFATIVLKYISHKSEIMISMVIVTGGFFVSALVDSKYGAIGGLLVVYFGFGFLEVGANAFSSIFFVKDAGIWINIEHGVYGVGALLGPLLAGFISKNMKNGYRDNYLIFAISGVLIFISLICAKFERIHYNEIPESPDSPPSVSDLPELTITECLKDKLVWLYTITLGVQCNVEMAATNWAVLYIQDVLNLSAVDEGSFFMTAFYVLFTLARLITGGIIQKIGYVNSLIISIYGCLIFYIAGFIFINKVGMFILMGTGFFVAPFWPTLMCSIMEVYQSQSSTPTSIIVTLQGLLIVLTNFLQGYINEKIGKAWGYRTTIPLCILTLILLYFVKKTVNQRLCERNNLLHNDVEMVQVVSESSNSNNNNNKENNKMKKDESTINNNDENENKSKSKKKKDKKNRNSDDDDDDDSKNESDNNKEQEDKIEIKVDRNDKKQIGINTISSSEDDEDEDDEKSNLISK